MRASFTKSKIVLGFLLVTLSSCRFLLSELSLPMGYGEELTFRRIELGTRVQHENLLWSPSGKYLAVTVRSNDRPGDTLWIVEGDREYALETFGSVHALSWRGENEISVSAGGQIFSIDLTSGNKRSDPIDGRLTDWYESGFKFIPENPDVFVFTLDTNLQPNQRPQRDLYSMNLETGEQLPIRITDGSDEFHTRISNDGRMLAFYEVDRSTVEGRTYAGSQADIGILLDDNYFNFPVAVNDLTNQLSIGPGGRLVAFKSQWDDDEDYFPYFLNRGIYVIDPTSENPPALLLSMDDVRDGVGGFDWSEATGRLAFATVGGPGQGTSILVSDPITPEQLARLTP